MVSADRQSNDSIDRHLRVSVTPDRPVNVELFVMSKCPDAGFCQRSFLPSLLKLSSIVNFTVSFIAAEPHWHQFHCMHGNDECTGNKQQLCIQDMYPQRDFMEFLQCQSRHVWRIPYSGETCAKEMLTNRIQWSDVQVCVASERANALFHQSLARTNVAAAHKSCTIHLDGKFWCMHDGVWFQCSEGFDEMSFIRAICSRYNGKNKPMECAAASEEVN